MCGCKAGERDEDVNSTRGVNDSKSKIPVLMSSSHFFSFFFWTMTKTTFYYTILLALCQATASSAWVAVAPNTNSLCSKQKQSSKTTLYAQDRRQFVTSSLSIIGSSLLTPLPGHAAATNTPQQQKDKDNIVKGYNRLQYLLDNWVEKTTVCKIGQETT